MGQGVDRPVAEALHPDGESVHAAGVRPAVEVGHPGAVRAPGVVMVFGPIGGVVHEELKAGVREARRWDIGRVQGLVHGHVEPPDGRAADTIACPEGEEAIVLPEDGSGIG